jgi:hypothetical protein
MFYNASKYSSYTKISWSIERIICRNVSRGLKTTCKFWIAHSKQPSVYKFNMSTNMYWMYGSIVQPRNYNWRKLSGIISNAKRRMERYERYNLFINKGIILNCIVFWNIKYFDMSKGLKFWLYFTNFSQIIRHLATCSVNWYIEEKDLCVEATISISEERNINIKYRNLILRTSRFCWHLINYKLGLCTNQCYARP